jgi:hypothetical protein
MHDRDTKWAQFRLAPILIAVWRTASILLILVEKVRTPSPKIYNRGIFRYCHGVSPQCFFSSSSTSSRRGPCPSQLQTMRACHRRAMILTAVEAYWASYGVALRRCFFVHGWQSIPISRLRSIQNPQTFYKAASIRSLNSFETNYRYSCSPCSSRNMCSPGQYASV